MGKSSNHKGSNTFRFQTFSERIANINIDVIHQIRHHDDTPEETLSYFGEALQKQSELNCTEHFTQFRKEISDQVQTFAQLVYHEENIVAALKKHLAVPNSMALTSLLDLLVQLARDLQADFYRHFHDFFDILVGLLNTYTQDVEVLESTFSSLSYIFKFLWRYLLKDVQIVYKYFSALLGKNYKQYVRNFAAESFAYLMRKSKDPSALCDFLFSTLQDDPDKAEGVGRLLFEMMKGVKVQFHSSSFKILPVLMQKLGAGENQVTLPWQQVEVAMTTLVLSMAEHSNKKYMSQIQDLILGSLMTTYKKIDSKKSSTENVEVTDMLERQLRLAKELIEFHQGKQIADPDAVAKLMIDIVRGHSLPDSTGLVVLDVTSCLLTSCHPRLSIENTSKLIQEVFKTNYSEKLVFDFTKGLFDLALFEKDVLPPFIKYCDKTMKKDDSVKEQVLLAVSELLLYKCPQPADGSDLSSLDTYMLDFGSGSSDQSFPSLVTQSLENSLDMEDSAGVARLWAALICVPHVRPLNKKEKCLNIMSGLMKQLLASKDKSEPSRANSEFLACQAFVSMVMMMEDQQVFGKIPVDLVINAISERSTSVLLLRLVDLYFTHAVDCDHQDVLTPEVLLKIFPSLQENLSSPKSMVRLHTLRIFSSFDLPLPPSEVETVDVFKICLSAETTSATVHDYREKLRHLQKLEYKMVQNSIPAGPFTQVPLRYLIGSLFVNFKLIWDPVSTLISSHAYNMDKEEFWQVYAQQLQLSSDKSEEQLFSGVSSQAGTESVIEETESDDVSSVFTTCLTSLSGTSESAPSYCNFRELLWKTMHNFPEKCASKSRVFVPMLFQFLKNEYYLTDMSVAPTQNVLRQNWEEVSMETEDTETESSQNVDTDKLDKVGTVIDIARQNMKKLLKKKEKSENRNGSDYAQTGGIDDGKTGKDGERGEGIASRIRTRSQCSVNSEISDVDTHGKVKEFKGRKRELSESEASDLDRKKGKKGLKTKQLETPSRMHTRSMDNAKHDDDSDDDEDSGNDTENDLNDDNNDDSVSDNDDDNSDNEEVEIENEKGERKSAIQLGKENMDVDTEDNLDGKKTAKEISKKLDSKNDSSGKKSRDSTTRVDKKRKKATTSSLLVQLELFSKFSDPRSMYMEPQLRQLYFDLLIHKSADVQRMAFQCIMTYKYKYLTPYKENFERLLDDKSFKNEIILFSIDNENSALKEEHRSDVLPILMRILYGKMHVKTGKGTSGKNFSKIRQAIVFQFLNGCQTDELKIFMDLVFSSFQQFVTDNTLKMIKDIKENTDLTKVLPVKRMQGALNSIDVIFKKLGHLLDSFLQSVIQMIIGLGTLCSVLLGNREKLVPHVINPLKDVRQHAVYRMIQVLEDFDMYPWRPVQIDAMFESLIWPQLDKLPFEGVYHPTPLLKLLLCCTKNPRYHKLLGKHHRDNPELSPLPYIMKLLLKNDVSGQVTACIMEMLYNLLEELDEEEEFKVVEVNHMLKLSSAENVNERDVGIRLLLPHVKDILVYLEKYVSSLNTLLHKKSKITGKELDILSRISRFVEDEETSTTLVSLLLPFLNPKYSKPLKVEEDILKSILNLLMHITDRLQFFEPVSKLFSKLWERSSRVLLTSAFDIICEQDEDLKPLGVIVRQLNSWDRTRMDEPNYLLRLEGYKSATSLLRNMVTMETRICLTLIYNCCFFVSTVEDMSIRDNSTLCLVTMVNQFGSLPFDGGAYNKIIMSALLPNVKLGLRTKKQVVFHEFVTILATLVDTFGDQSSFCDLKPLRDKDVEADFFENIKHIQVFKRSRALRRLIKYLYSNNVRVETLTNIFLPMVGSFLIDDSYKKYTSVLDSAIDAIGLICRLLPWKCYIGQLKHYLTLLSKKIERQKLFVKVIVSVLDNFHFDLRKSTLNVKNTPIPKVIREPPENTDKKTEVVDIDYNEDVVKEDTEDKPPEINEEGDNSVVIDADKGKQLCDEPLATKIHNEVLKTVIHQLHSILVQKAKSDGEHKMIKSKYPEDDEILRVPIALAMVKLLQNLPKGALGRYLPGILLKVCNFLKSRAMDIRNTARDTLVKIQTTLGPRYFPFILSELKGSLRRGYQRHVLSYTVHQLLKHMETVVRPGDIDICLSNLQEVLNEEIFGEVSDEKEVDGIKAKVFEARSSKSYESYQFIARYISPGSLMKLLDPIKKILDSTSSHRSARKVQDVLKRITAGLMENKNMSLETLLVFVHGLTTETLPLLKEQKVQPKEETSVIKPGQQPKSCLLIPKAAPRGGIKPKTSKKTNKHVLVQFGLQLLSMCLKKQKVSVNDNSHIAMLDPLVPMLAECLFSKYIMVNASSLRVLCKVLKFPIPSIETNITRIANGMFVLLRNYASAGAAKGDNMELVSMLFKAVTVLVREVKSYTLGEDQLQVLLTFCEEDIHDFNRQSTAFSLLKAILSRILDIPAVHQLMKKVEDMSITAESTHVQRECRQAMMQYLMDYRHGKKIRGHLQFYVSNLNFQLESGRESTLEMLASFFTTFPQNLLKEHSGLFFVPMAASLANDESAKCRKLIALAIKTLLIKLDYDARTNLFGISMKWFMDDKLRHRSLAAQLCGLFVEVESAQFESRLAETLPVIEQQLEPGKYTQVDSTSVEHNQDQMIYHTLNALLKILRECGQVITDSKWEANMNIIWDHVESYLNYPHIWVQLAASQMFGLLFAAWQPEQLVTVAMEPSTQYITTDLNKKLKKLAADFLTQLQSELLNDDLADQVIKNMIFLVKCAKQTSVVGGEKASTDDDQEEKTQGLSVLWLVRKMVREANHEAINNNKSIIKRMNVFKWLAAVALELGESMEPAVLTSMLPPLQRELNDQSLFQDAGLRSLSQEVVEMLKKTVGVEKFSGSYATTQKVRAERRDQRKKEKAFQAVANPELHAKRKIKKNLNKIAAKKRKVEKFKPSKKAMKRKFQEFAITEDI